MRNKNRFIFRLCILLATTVVSLVIIGIGIWQSIPDVQAMKGCLKTEMYGHWLCPGGDNYVSLNAISPHAIQAIVLSEDGGFYGHKGFDWYEIQKSLEQNINAGRYARGGSTITQQLAKNVFLSAEKSIIRKLKEAYLTVQIEKSFSKTQILERYLNVIEFGPGVYGIKAASQYYFNKLPHEIDLLESAFLAFVIPNPKTYQQSFKQKDLTPFARKRLAAIIKTMARYGKIGLEEAQGTLQILGDISWIDRKDFSVDEEIPMDEPAVDLESPPAHEAPPSHEEPPAHEEATEPTPSMAPIESDPSDVESDGV